MRQVVAFLLLILIVGCGTSQKPKEPTKEIEGPKEYPVHMTEGVKKNLSFVYSNIQTEIPFCTFGEIAEDSIVVDRVAMPKIHSTTDSTASFDARTCSNKERFIGYVHNHDPYRGLCTPSPTDIKRFVYDNRSKIEIIACTYELDTVFYAYVK